MKTKNIFLTTTLILSTFILSACSLFPQNLAINTDKGQIVIKLYPDKSPKTVANFLTKAKNDFYKNLTFHRVEPGFVIQGGDPLGNGTGGGQIASEINDVPFKEGSVGLARGADIKVSNDSQFFICLTTQACQGLSNQYVNFGEVVSGMDVAQKIAVGDKILSVTPDTK
ncbi:TPA: peptidylprolyl isomerase [Candidatus Shapirobacteria bacterium]|uniref:Peptidyl-prolyl cis-trans isomerase n=1 Tax=Candidatus Shapirobacteria bacterium GW2011_GWE2_38_30 TaxID=1618490 RepID=A0A0G0JYF2_9BACT|nr:MAG: Peptidylprolyl isomerase [Candidatus Shapirobacteria bacterium GW2011_GWE2_38_30]HCU55282.1 peptidylprolyl isomerase [Candidatus Shapirobacteria bacterium]